MEGYTYLWVKRKTLNIQTMRYRAFRTKKDGKFHFQFLTESEEVILRSQPYEDKDACFNGIRSVMSNASEKDNYSNHSDGEGGHYFIIKATNGQEIGRSISYSSIPEMEKAMEEFIENGPNAEAKSKSADSESLESSEKPYAEGKRHSDDYRPLAFYQARIKRLLDGFESFYDEETKEWYFTYNQDGHIILISEGYQSESSRDNGIKSVTKNLPIPERYDFQRHPNGKYYFNLKAGNHQEIATSVWFESEGISSKVASSLQTSTQGEGNVARAMGT